MRTSNLVSHSWVRWMLMTSIITLYLAATPMSVWAQGDDPLPHPPSATEQVRPAELSLDVPVAPAAVPTVGEPGLSYRYVKTFGETEVAYIADAAHLNYPWGIGADGNGIWIGERWGNRVLKYDSTGNVQIQWGQAGFPDTDADTSFWEIVDVAADSGGNIWVTDEAGNRVVKLNGAGEKLLELGEVWREGSDNAHFIDPQSVAFDAAGNVYVSDGAPWWNSEHGNHRVQVFQSDGTYLTTIGQTGTCGSGNNQFCGPRHIAIYGNELYVTDANNGRLQILNIVNPAAPSYVATISGLNNPSGVAADAEYIYVADRWNHQVKIYGRTTRTLVATIGSEKGNRNDQFNEPTDVALDTAGNLYVADFVNVRVQQFRRSGSNWSFVRTYGVTGVPYETDGYHYNIPSGVAVAKDGAIYLTEDNGHRLVKLSANGTPLWTVGAAGVKGDWDYGNDRLNNPADVALDAAGNAYVASRWHGRVQKFSPAGSFVALVDNLNCPGGVTVASNNYLYVANTCDHTVVIYDAALVQVATLGTRGESGTDNAHFNSPEDVAVDSKGRIYVADQNNHRVQVFDANRNYVQTIGQSGVSGGDFAHFYHPTGLFVDGVDRLYVADEWNNRIQVFDSNWAYSTSIGGSWGNRTGQLRGTSGVAVDLAGNVYVADRASHRLQKFSPGVPRWIQGNINGFGDRSNQVTSLAEFGNFLYVGTYRVIENGAQIWRMDRSGNWSAVVTDGFGVTTNVGVDDLLEFNGALYAGVWSQGFNSAAPPGGEIWRSSNGTAWEQVASGGMGDSRNSQFFSLAEFDNQIFAGTWSYTNTHAAEIWKSSTGNAGDWTQVATNGIGDEANRAILNMQEMDGTLYASTRSQLGNGADIWRYDGVNWSAVITDGFGYTGTYDIAALEVFSDHLYAGTGRYDDVTQSYPGGQLWRCPRISGCDAASDWQVVIADGFGNANNLNITSLLVFDSHLYAVVTNFESGLEIWRSGDGETWSQIGHAGFGDSNSGSPYWDNGTAIFNGSFFVGLVNNASAGKVWQFLANNVFLPNVKR